MLHNASQNNARSDSAPTTKTPAKKAVADIETPFYETEIPLPVLRTSGEKHRKSCQAEMWVTLAAVEKSFLIPESQRPTTVNDKVLGEAERYKTDPTLDGVVLIAVVDGKMYIYDAQHRVFVAFRESGVPRLHIQVQFTFMKDMAAVGKAFLRANDHLVVVTPNNKLNASGNKAIRAILAQKGTTVTVDKKREQGSGAQKVSLSLVLRAWLGSGYDTPQGSAGKTATEIAETLTMADADQLNRFLNCAAKAWRDHAGFGVLYGHFNLALCMWLFRHTVLTPGHDTTPLDEDQFRAGLTGLSSDDDYLNFLVKRKLEPLQRKDGYKRICKLFGPPVRAGWRFRPALKLPKPTWSDLE